MNSILLYPIVILLYVVWLIQAWRAPQQPPVLWERVLSALVLLAHGWLFHQQIFMEGGLRFGFAQALSATLWLGLLVFWLESWQVSLQGMRLLLLPVAALSALLPLVFTGSVAQGPMMLNPWFKVHIYIALAAYGLFTIAALHAVMMLVLSRTLHDKSASTGWLNQMARGLPALLTLERLLFRMLWLGFAMLTMTLITGIVFSEQLLGLPVRLDHKTIFSLLAWMVFAILLAGRYCYGWRGKLALRYTLGGFALLLLSYIGSRFVLEVILQRV